MSQLILEAKIAKQVLREHGVRALFQKYGWKLVVGIFCYYLIRDVFLYVLVPMVLIRSF